MEAGREVSWVRNFTLLWLARFGCYFSLHEFQPFLPPYLAQMGASAATIGIVMGAFPLTAMVARAPAALLMGRFGRRPFLIWGTVIFSLATLGYLWAASVAFILLLRVVQGLGWSGSTTSIATLTADIAPKEKRGTLIGYGGASTQTVLFALHQCWKESAFRGPRIYLGSLRRLF